VNSEVSEQVTWIEGLVGHLNCMAVRLAAAPGVVTVLDTNVLLHYQPPEQVEWAKVTGVTGVDPVRLVLPLRVIEELDEKKYTARPDIRDRARRLLSDLWGRLAGTAGGPVLLRENVTIEVPVDEGDRARPLDADQEVLDTCEQLRNVGQRVILVTGDTGLSLRAIAARLTVVRMPDTYLRGLPLSSTRFQLGSVGIREPLRGGGILQVRREVAEGPLLFGHRLGAGNATEAVPTCGLRRGRGSGCGRSR